MGISVRLSKSYFLTGANHLRSGTDKSRKAMIEFLGEADTRIETLTDSERNHTCFIISLMMERKELNLT
jgi:hypothetical protein